MTWGIIVTIMLDTHTSTASWTERHKKAEQTRPGRHKYSASSPLRGMDPPQKNTPQENSSTCRACASMIAQHVVENQKDTRLFWFIAIPPVYGSLSDPGEHSNITKERSKSRMYTMTLFL